MSSQRTEEWDAQYLVFFEGVFIVEPRDTGKWLFLWWNRFRSDMPYWNRVFVSAKEDLGAAAEEAAQAFHERIEERRSDVMDWVMDEEAQRLDVEDDEYVYLCEALPAYHPIQRLIR